MNDFVSRSTHSLIVLLIALSAVSCAKHSSPAPQEPWVAEGEVMRADTNAGGFRTGYSAYFTDAQLTKIVETRKGTRDGAGEYTFAGARLVRYKGTAIDRDDDIEVSFDMKGATASSSKNVSAEDVMAVRTRGQLLRSLALAHHSTTQHTGSSS